MSDSPGTHGGLRGRTPCRGRSPAAEAAAAASNAAASPEDEATVAVGLAPKQLTKQEERLFASRQDDYLRLRDKLLLTWHADCTKPVSLPELLSSVDDGSLSLARDAFLFLQEHGYINWGVLPGSDEGQQQDSAGAAAAEAAAAGAAGVAAAQAAANAASEAAAALEDDRAIVYKLYELLRAADMTTATEKGIRKQLQQHFATDLATKKQLIKEQVTYFIDHLDKGTDTLEPKGYEGQAQQAADTVAEAAKAREAAAEAAAAAKAAAAASARAAASALPPKPAGRVIVVGAGPAGLAAATLLKRNRVDVLVLEARDRVGGRVCSHTGPFAAPVDLGASLITGTAPDVAQGLAPDPVNIVCRQLGMQLHMLGGALPLYDAAGQLVAPELDAAVDKLRDELLDAAAERGEEQGTEDESLGAALDAVLKQRLAATAEAEAAAAAAAEGGGEAAVAAANGVAEAAAASAEDGSSREAAAPAAAAAAAQQQQQPDKQDADPGKPGAAPGSTAAEAPAGVADPAAEAAAAEPAAVKPEAAPIKPEPAPTAAGDAAQANGDAAAGDDAPAAAGNAAAAPAAVTAEDAAPRAAAAEGEEAAGAAVPSSSSGGAAAGAVTPAMLQLLNWHWANLEYGCAAPLSEVSLAHWNDDEDLSGGFGGPHAMVVGGFDQAMKGLASQLGGALRLSCPVAAIDYSAAAEQQGQGEQQQQQQQAATRVRVTTAAGEVLEAAAVLVTVPLGVLKAGGVAFTPPLPEWKASAIGRLGFGALNKVLLQFPSVFWDPAVDYFGIAQPPGPDTRGRCFMFWNISRFSGAPLLAALVSGAAAREAERQSSDELAAHAVQALRRVYGEQAQAPVALHSTRWSSDEFSRGSYSYVAVGATGEEYDDLARPLGDCVLFAGEHTIKEHPDTVGGALLSGLREAARALHLLRGGADGAAAAALVGCRTEAHCKRKRDEEAAAAAASSEEPDEQPKKKHRDKQHKEKKEKKERRKRDKKEKQQKKEKRRQDRAARRGGAGSDEEAPAKPAARRASERRPAGVTPEEARQAAAARDLLWTDQARLWKGLLNAQKGDMALVNEVVDACDSLVARQLCMASILKASAGALQQLSQDVTFLRTLNGWLADLVLERSDANLHVLLKVLQLLQKLGCSAWAPLLSSGLVGSVKAASDHRKRDVAELAASISKAWAASNPNKPAPKQQPQARRASDTTAGARRLAAQPAAAQQQQQQPVAPGPLQMELLDEEERRVLEEAQAAVEQAKAEAAAAAAELAEVQQAAPRLPSSGGARIASFGEYKRQTKRAKQDEEEEAEEERQLSAKRAKTPSGSRPSSGGGSAGGGSDGKEAATKELREFVKAQLKPRFHAKQLDNDGCKWVLDKVVDKVLASTSAADVGGGAAFMNERRQKKVAALVDSYAAKKRQPSGGGGKGGGA